MKERAAYQAAVPASRRSKAVGRRSCAAGFVEADEAAREEGAPPAPGWRSRASSPKPASIRSTRSNGSSAPRVIGNERGEVVFEQRDVEIPKAWSQQATNIVVSKYFRGQIGTPERERSVKQLIGRVVDTITEWAQSNKYFATDEDLQAFSDDLKHILVYQKAAFNSPVWFNCGFEKAPQCSACFINSVQDTMDSILTLARTEGMLFKFGSGTGTNLSPIRSSQGAARRRRHGVGPGVVHEGLRRVRRRDQVGRQDAPRGEDGDPQRRPSRTSSSSSTARSRKRRRRGR